MAFHAEGDVLMANCFDRAGHVRGDYRLLRGLGKGSFQLREDREPWRHADRVELSQNRSFTEASFWRAFL